MKLVRACYPADPRLELSLDPLERQVPELRPGVRCWLPGRSLNGEADVHPDQDPLPRPRASPEGAALLRCERGMGEEGEGERAQPGLLGAAQPAGRAGERHLRRLHGEGDGRDGAFSACPNDA